MLVAERIKKTGSAVPAFQIDDDLAERLLKFSWRLDRYGYLGAFVKAKGKDKWISLHRAVWFCRHGKWPKEDIDHISRDKLDNRSANLRFFQRGKPRFDKWAHLPKGVYFHPKNCKSRPYMAHVWLGRPKGLKFVGHFATIEEAVEARDKYLSSITEAEGCS